MKAITILDGARIAYQEWGCSSSTRKLLGLHGWLDNSNSFAKLGPKLADIGYHCIAIDHIGHGWSSHLPSGSLYNTGKYISVISQVVDELGWSKMSLLGHSMGAGLSLVYSGTFPEKIEKAVFIEGFGPVTVDPKTTAQVLRNAVESEKRAMSKKLSGGGPKLYSSFSDAVNARVGSVSKYPGEQTLSHEAAAMLVARATFPDTEGREFYAEITESYEGGVRFRHDQNLLVSSPIYHSNEQCMAYVDAITAKSLLITAVDGWPPNAYAREHMQDRADCLIAKGLLTHMHLNGSHHLHLDPETRTETEKNIVDFLK